MLKVTVVSDSVLAGTFVLTDFTWGLIVAFGGSYLRTRLSSSTTCCVIKMKLQPLVAAVGKSALRGL
jgi:hypothetical protein